MNNNVTLLTAMRLSVAQGIARVTLTQGARGNPFDATFCSDLNQIAKAISEQADIRVIVFDAEGEAFSYGGDLKALTRDRSSFVAMTGVILPQLGAALEMLRAHDAPLVAMVHGVAAGGGLGLVTACDFILASSTARFVAAFSGIGMSADTGTSYFLPRRIGLTRASAFLLMNQSWNAQEAHYYGLVTSVYPPKDLAAATADLVARLAQGPIRAYGDIKRLLDASSSACLSEQLRAEVNSIAGLCQTDDVWNAMNAVLAKRAPVFLGC